MGSLQTWHTPKVPVLIRPSASSIARKRRLFVWRNWICNSASASALAWSIKSPSKPPAAGIWAPTSSWVDNNSRCFSSKSPLYRCKSAEPMIGLPWQLSATCLLILVGLKFTAVNVILVGLDVSVPFLRQIIQRENCSYRTDRNTGAAVNALSGIDVQLRYFIESRAAIIIGAALCRMDTIHWAYIDTGSVFRPDTGFGNDVGHRSPPRVDRISLQKAGHWCVRCRPVNNQIHPADPDSNPRRCTRVPALFLQLKSGGSSPSLHKPPRKTRGIVCVTLSERMSRP